MNNEELILISISLIAGFSATLPAAILWSKTRDSSWIMFILGTFVYFINTLIQILDSNGIFIYSLLKIGNISLLKILLTGLPFILFSVGFIIIIRRKNRSVN